LADTVASVYILNTDYDSFTQPHDLTTQPMTHPNSRYASYFGAILPILCLAGALMLGACSPKNDNISALQQEVWKNPEDTATMLKLGNAYAQQNRYDEAEETYKNALALDPELDAAYHSLGAVYFNRQDYPQARDWFKRHLARSPKDSLRLYDLGNALMQMKEYAKAADAYSAAIDNSHSFTEAHYNLAVCFARTGRMDEARQIYNWLLDKNNYLAVSLQNHLQGGKQAD
jgi:tetratricopeptide (TPR) repeat protein